jgi:SAM-dependent methyltransferase
MELKQCLLCRGNLDHFTVFRNIIYHRCLNCHALLMDPRFYLSPAAEKERYDQHNNDPADPGYRRFVSPLVERVKAAYSTEAKGLDYGAGPGPVVSALLKEAGYRPVLYDPFYWKEPTLLEDRYDYIVCCEVIEHFHQPYSEFKRLRSLLNPGGALFCMTELYEDSTDFESWHYKNDPTHVFFYHQDSLTWIRNRFSFSALEISGRLIVFQR